MDGRCPRLRGRHDAGSRQCCSLWDFLPVKGTRIHVVVPARGAHTRGGVCVHSTLHLPEAECAIRDNIPVTSVARTLLDLAESDPDRLPRAWATAARRRLLDLRAVEAACENGHGRRGLKHLVPLLEDRTRVIPDTRRELEALFFDCAARSTCRRRRATYSWRATSWMPSGRRSASLSSS